MAEKSIHLDTLEKLQFALKDFDMSFSTSNKLFRMAIASELIDTVGLFEQLADDWKVNLPFGEGPDADIDFDYWTDWTTWENLHSRAMQNECVDGLPIPMGNGRTSDEIKRMKKSTFTKYYRDTFKSARYEGRETAIDFIKFIQDDKTGTTRFGNIVFYALLQLISAIEKTKKVLQTPSEAALTRYYDAQLNRAKPYIDYAILKINDILKDTTIPEKRKENSLRAMKDTLGDSLREAGFLNDIKATFNQYDIADYRKENKQQQDLSDDKVLDILAISDLFDKEGNPYKSKIARHIFERRKNLSREAIASFYVYTNVLPIIDQHLPEHKNLSIGSTSRPPKEPIQPDRNYITFKMGNITDGHLQMLRKKLVDVGWIAKDTQPDDFGKLFSGKTNTTKIIWTGIVGKGMLRFLFAKMVEQRFIIVPDSHSIDTILENHFIDTDGNYLSGLNSSKESIKHLPVIKECLDILQLEADTD